MKFPIKQFLSYYRPYLSQLSFVLICAFVTTILALMFPLLVRYVTGEMLAADLSVAQAQVFWVGLLMVAITVLQQASRCFLDYKGHLLGARMEKDLRGDLFQHIQRLSFSFFDQAKTGELMSRISHDLYAVSEVYHHGIEDIILFGFRFIGAFSILFIMNWRLSLIVIAFLPIMAWFSYLYNKKLNKTMLDNKEKIAEIHAQVEDSLSGVRVVQSFANEQLEINKFKQRNNQFFSSRKETYQAETVLYTGVESFIQAITIAVVLIGANMIMEQALELPDLIAFMLYVEFLVAPIRRMLLFSSMLQEALTGFQRFSELIGTQAEIRNPQNPKQLQISGEIVFNQVAFQYNNTDLAVLKKLNLTISPGEYVALVGASGAGKTTISALIPRFYDVTEGCILVDGCDVREIDLTALRQQIGIVQQDVYLFSGSVKDNIRYGNPAATDEQIIEAAKQANAHDFIINLPKGYDSDIGQRGVRLSGGQKQRLSIARVFLKNPPILILDEATSALDNESEYIVKASMEKLAKGRTTLVIAHRLSTIQNAQRIVVLSDGAVVEEGTHEGLINQEGAYAHLYEQQFKQ
ncbi:ATP-binding cassette, subfamily B [Amphibacillus marinus]|uniref:ATP-binding cassette, subfamily B n=1 Tax=Amphibacillus marinus TaxID=872970 RepID=A0A1H8S883_9BACI|nr:ABC transporter ATP-binding protein [Amphibacillus marinus]SEO74604.1 ATP-binding cassette, subfamily B [Amphibacillus marinus]